MQVDIYYSGYISVDVEPIPEAHSYTPYLEKARKQAEQLRVNRQDKFIEELIPNLEPWSEADQIRE